MCHMDTTYKNDSCKVNQTKQQSSAITLPTSGLTGQSTLVYSYCLVKSSRAGCPGLLHLCDHSTVAYPLSSYKSQSKLNPLSNTTSSVPQWSGFCALLFGTFAVAHHTSFLPKKSHLSTLIPCHTSACFLRSSLYGSSV